MIRSAILSIVLTACATTSSASGGLQTLNAGGSWDHRAVWEFYDDFLRMNAGVGEYDYEVVDDFRLVESYRRKIEARLGRDLRQTYEGVADTKAADHQYFLLVSQGAYYIGYVIRIATDVTEYRKNYSFLLGLIYTFDRRTGEVKHISNTVY